MNKKSNLFSSLEKSIESLNIGEALKLDMFRKIQYLKKQTVNMLITGATGAGKSSTINALFDCDVAKVGVGVDPETMDIQKYELKNLILWDSPGLGDGREADNRHAKAIIDKLSETDDEGNALIDLVLVILDGSSRDLGTSFELINNVIIPNLGEDKDSRLLVAINQADMAMKGRFWSKETNSPEPELVKFLDEKAASTRSRIKESTSTDVEVIYYSAGYKDGDSKQNPYNLSKLLYYIIQHTSEDKRLVYANNMSDDKNMWKDNDDSMDYNREIKAGYVATGATIGATIGGVFGGPIGSVIGGAIGGFLGSFF